MFGNAIYSTGAKPGCRSARHGGEHGRGAAYGMRGEFGGGPRRRAAGPRGRGRRARRGDIRTAALLLLAEEPRNGYQIMQEVQERSGGMWSPSPGSVYPALQQLEDEGLIRTEESEGRKLFAITDEGRALLAERGADRPAPWEQTGDGAGGDARARKAHARGRLRVRAGDANGQRGSDRQGRAACSREPAAICTGSSPTATPERER